MKRYEALTGRSLDEDLSVALLINIRVKDVRERLETDNKDISHEKVRDDILAYIERRREAQVDGPVPMDASVTKMKRNTPITPRNSEVGRCSRLRVRHTLYSGVALADGFADGFATSAGAHPFEAPPVLGGVSLPAKSSRRPG